VPMICELTQLPVEQPSHKYLFAPFPKVASSEVCLSPLIAAL
jgi:hypothetical protein